MERAASVDPAEARILEIGFHAVMKSAFPERTQLLWGYPKLGEPRDFYTPFSLASGWRAWRDIRRGKYDLIVVWVDPYAPWDFRRLKAVIGKPIQPLRSLVRIFAVQMLRLVNTKIPIVAIDNEDSRTIAHHNMFLLDKAKYFFKRELPVDRWQVFQHTLHAGMPGARFRSKTRYRRRVEKLRPMSIGCTFNELPPAEFTFPTKTTDIFAAMTLQGGTTVRNEGIAQLRALAKHGIVVDIPEQRLSKAEFYERMSRAWLTWSPEGLGWDCFRHYEAPVVGTIPVMNQPTIARYRPLLDGEHAFYYHPDDPEGLHKTVAAALADKDRLRNMALAAREQVLKYHVRPRPFADVMIRMALGLEEAPGGVKLDE